MSSASQLLICGIWAVAAAGFGPERRRRTAPPGCCLGLLSPPWHEPRLGGHYNSTTCSFVGVYRLLESLHVPGDPCSRSPAEPGQPAAASSFPPPRYESLIPFQDGRSWLRVSVPTPPPHLLVRPPAVLGVSRRSDPHHNVPLLSRHLRWGELLRPQLYVLNRPVSNALIPATVGFRTQRLRLKTMFEGTVAGFAPPTSKNVKF
ncbi:hypothetical protein SKAU_G00369070 [Synaphobranchus kaupii]|uniref:Uncharacterized protein n=1 Tax=Synaphobranchus kaupii TaxID=118154 RepID=A0A9Q1EFP3_SYNKA|nr:hypothetical protein SKAU_G00369070 [Synaphobranchus kaupii]